ncbi:MAG: 2-oxo acid dehydrogenase subunit E2 [Fibrobacter sp.]|jgi:pyruvate dehydrogenase E2 component (dihydrolipoamide acetyltransferase)|nr:2-oxo acid dehydrogenase subunit E2 [Fibrobacter sp.]
MAEKIVMLALSPTMETGTIVKWHKSEGDKISAGDILCEVETDKATMDYESTVEGTLLKITSAEGSQVKVGEIIGIAGKEGEDISGLIEQASPEVEKKQPQEKAFEKGAEKKKKIPPPLPQEHVPSGVRASPLARQLAKESGINLQSVQGSGPGGRIIKEDIEQIIKKKKPSEAPITEQVEQKIAISEKRRIIAQRMSQSMFSAPHYYVTVVVKMNYLMNSRKALNSRLKTKISFNAFFIKLVAEALARNPVINSSWSEDFIIRHNSIDIGLAVAQKDGLITPVVRDCANKGIVAINQELDDLVERARNGKLSWQEYTGGTFTISNLGSYGVRQFTAIINPPESAILALGEIFEELIISDDGEFRKQNSMMMTLSCDHRVIDGAIAAEFVRDLKNMMENPVTVLY